MQADDVRWLFAYDRWATRRVLNVLDGINPDVWTRPHVVGDRGLGGILVHHLGASMRWRVSFETQGEEEGRELEREPMATIDEAGGARARGPVPAIAELRGLWQEEWAAVDAWLPTLTDGFIGHVFDGVPVWQMLV